MESALFEVGIGLMFVYLILSLVVTAANELIAQVTSLRARTLAAALPQIVDDGKLLGDVLNHGLVNGIASVSTGGAVAPTAASVAASYLPSRNFAGALLASLDPDHPVPSIATVTQAVTNLPDTNVRDSLLSAIAHAGGDITRARDNIAAWFDGAMDRLSGVYKRRIQCIGMILALALAFGLDVDSIRVAGALWADTSLRDAVSQAAVNVTTTSDSGKVTCDAAPKDTTTDFDQSPAERAADCLRQLQSVRDFPIGWPAGRLTPHSIIHNIAYLGWVGTLTKFLGFLITAFAVSLGAPFWFDMLSKFVRLRATGNPPARAQASTATTAD